MSSDLSGEITAIATAVLAAFAIITAVVAYMAFRRQGEEVGILQQQMREQQQVLTREARDRHRAQASRVFLSLEYPSEHSACFNIVNTSDQPIYEAEIRWLDHTSPVPCIRHVQVGTILASGQPTGQATVTCACSNASTRSKARSTTRPRRWRNYEALAELANTHLLRSPLTQDSRTGPVAGQFRQAAHP
jgi:hypothetical protein